MHQHHPCRELQHPMKTSDALFIGGMSGIVVADGHHTGGHLKLMQQVVWAIVLFLAHWTVVQCQSGNVQGFGGRCRPQGV